MGRSVPYTLAWFLRQETNALVEALLVAREANARALDTAKENLRTAHENLRLAGEAIARAKEPWPAKTPPAR